MDIEQPKNNTEKINNKETDKPKTIDSDYFSQSHRFYNDQIVNLEKNAKNDEDFEYIDYLKNNRDLLGNLSNEKRLARMEPKDFAPAIIDLAGDLAVFNPFTEQAEKNRKNLPEIDNSEDKYFKTKDLFIRSCQKIYPNADINFSNDKGLYPIITDIEKLSPKEQIKNVDKLIDSSLKWKAKSYENYQKMDKDFDQFNTQLSSFNERFYKLQLLRDKLQKELYGNSNISFADAKKVDSIRKEIKPVSQEKEKSDEPIYEKITPENFNKYLNQNKEVFLNGDVFNVETNKNGDIFIKRSISIKEALALAEETTRANKGGAVNTGMIKERMFSIPKDELISSGKWIVEKPARSLENPQRLKEVEEAKGLQARIQSDEFKENIGGSWELLNDVFLREANKLSKEKENYNKNI